MILFFPAGIKRTPSWQLSGAERVCGDREIQGERLASKHVPHRWDVPAPHAPIYPVKAHRDRREGGRDSKERMSTRFMSEKARVRLKVLLKRRCCFSEVAGSVPDTPPMLLHRTARRTLPGAPALPQRGPVPLLFHSEDLCQAPLTGRRSGTTPRRHHTHHDIQTNPATC
jgi:hypothetical protein